MRGQKFFNELINSSEEIENLGKGRNATLLEKRNECLIARFYYFSRISKKTYEEVLNKLMDEFFITPERITHLIQENSEQLLRHKKEKTTIYFLKNKYPHLKWWQ